MKLIAVLFCCATGALAQAPIPRYEVHRASSPVVVDGKPDEKAWSAAGRMELIFPWDSQTGAKQKTVARLLWDDQNLYVSYECEDADIVAFHTEHDDPTYLDDAVEIFINPMPSQTGIYYGLEMNARAVLYDYVMYQSKYLFKPFDLRGVRLATSIDGTMNVRGDKDKGWSLEVAIPWANFEALSQRPTVGAIWTANLNRWDGVEPNRRMSNWSDPLQPRPNPHVPARFGQLVFVE
ncbi:MAG: carbohydrate-binding family 9-like protein [Acidobacteriota bacterium]|nr:carbohydrate-binding family 9-like protein [Acidobacteriota bacterium]